MYLLIVHANSLTSGLSRARAHGPHHRVARKAKKYAGAFPLREHARVSRIPVAAPGAATQPGSVYADGLKLVAPRVGNGRLAAVVQHDRRAVGGMQPEQLQ